MIQPVKPKLPNWLRTPWEQIASLGGKLGEVPSIKNYRPDMFYSAAYLSWYTDNSIRAELCPDSAETHNSKDKPIIENQPHRVQALGSRTYRLDLSNYDLSITIQKLTKHVLGLIP